MKFQERLKQLVEESEQRPAEIATGMGITLRGLELGRTEERRGGLG